jgi:hypothetical protein
MHTEARDTAPLASDLDAYIRRVLEQSAPLSERTRQSLTEILSTLARARECR